ncbi:unnamed protein product [Ectocarpus sp. CCAP 1310/34]|nr:unnamed protein product [Ectocarpus sp. CCAP 1310/34]
MKPSRLSAEFSVPASLLSSRVRMRAFIPSQGRPGNGSQHTFTEFEHQSPIAGDIR